MSQTFCPGGASIIQKIKGGSERPMQEEMLIRFLVENQERFYRLAYSYLGSREEALDAVQSAVCKALEKQDSLREAGAMHT